MFGNRIFKIRDRALVGSFHFKEPKPRVGSTLIKDQTNQTRFSARLVLVHVCDKISEESKARVPPKNGVRAFVVSTHKFAKGAETKMLGIIKVHDIKTNKFGFLISVETGENLFFSRHDIEAEAVQLSPGTPVEFELRCYRDNRTHQPRRKATSVKVANPNALLAAVKPNSQNVPIATFAVPSRARAYAAVADETVEQHLIEDLK